MKPARVVGAGLSGLAAAWHLADRGFDVTVIERANAPGGLIQSRPTPFGLVETAANAFVWDENVAEWFQRLDLRPEFPRPESRRRYIFRDGRAHRWPLWPAESAVMASRLSAAFLTRSMGARDRESVAQWGDRVLGAAATRWLLEPAMQGIYAAPPQQLSARAIFGARRRRSRKLAAPRGGMGEFISTMHKRLVQRGVAFRFGEPACNLEPETPTVIATGACEAAQLIAPHAPVLAQALGAITVSPLTTATLFFEPHRDDLHGFGILFPSGSGVSAFGVLFNADIFAGRSDVRSEAWIVGEREPGMTGWPEDRLLDLLTRDREKVTGRSAFPLAVHVTRWRRAVPVYSAAVLEAARHVDSLPPWLAISGNYLGRIGVATLLEQAAAAANRVR